ncbi:MAG: NAD-dependent epimerase/dehydratase family protein [Flavobacteriales bacterium]|nr:NAD-dependent epimerase/dehydratase family protein [Flavobacteriales bacterium]
MDRQVFENTNILITGASGFIGHALASSLVSIDCSLTRTSRDKRKLLPLDGPAKVTDTEIDYADATVWNDLVRDTETIFYLSAQTSSANSNKDPKQDFHHNVLPLLNLLEAIKETKAQPTVIFASTATIVGLTEDLPVAENAVENPITIYDIHKLCCEKYLSYYASNGHIRSCSLRLANVYGPGVNSSSADRGVLNMMIHRAIQNKTLSIFGEGLQIRDYTYISDIIGAFLVAAQRIDATNGQHFNIGSGQGHTFMEAFTEIANCAGAKLQHDVRIENIDAPSDLPPIEARDYIANTAKFTRATGWSAKTDLHSGIQKTLDHYLD